MSQVFRIKPQDIDSLHDVQELNIAQFLEYMDDEYECLNYETAEEQEELVGENYLYLGIPLHTARGFEFTCCDEPYFSVRVNTPASTKDWETALAFIEQLRDKVQGLILNEDDEELSDLSSINYKADIRYGIKHIRKLMKEEDLGEYTIVGSDRDCYLSEKMIDEVWEAENQIELWDQMLERIFHSEAYFAKQQFYQKTNEATAESEGLLAAYVIGAGYDFVLPLEASLRFFNSSIEDTYGKITEWQLIILLDDEHIEQLPYDKAIKMIQDYVQLDARQIEVSAKTEDELREIFGLEKRSFWDKMKSKLS